MGAAKAHGTCGGGGSSPGRSLPRTYSLERKGLQKYVSLPSDAALLQAVGTSSAGIAHLQGLQQPPTAESATPPSTGGLPAGKSGLAATSTGLAALARAGKIFNTNSVFDLEVSGLITTAFLVLSCLVLFLSYSCLHVMACVKIIGPDEKALIAVGDSWEWTPNKRLLQNVTEASMYHMKRATILNRFGSSQLVALPMLKCMRFVFNDFTSLKKVRTEPQSRC